jgi:pilus assembly protein CpaB
MNPRILLALAVSAGMALIVSAIFYQIAVRDQGQATEEVVMTDIVVAAKDLNIGATVAASDLRLEAWPSNKIPEGIHTELDELVGRVPISKILSNEPIVDRRLADKGSGYGLAPKVPPGMRAMSVRVNDVIGVSGFVLPEARVDVLVTGTPRGYEKDGRMTKTILSNVRVISAGENLEPDASGRPQRVAVVTLLITPEQAELLTLASAQGKLQLILRNSRDDALATTEGVREPEIFMAKVMRDPPRPRARPRPRPVRIVRAPPPPPPTVELEVIRGNRRSVQSFGAAKN